jgi:hypothetical protein
MQPSRNSGTVCRATEHQYRSSGPGSSTATGRFVVVFDAHRGRRSCGRSAFRPVEPRRRLGIPRTTTGARCRRQSHCRGSHLASGIQTSLNERALAPSTDRCLAILEVLSEYPAGLTLSEMHRLLGVRKNMAFRILTDMTAREFVYRDADKTCVLGRKLLELAAPRVSGRNLVDEAAPLVRALRDDCGESVGLRVPSGGEAVLIYVQPALHPMRLIFDSAQS